MVVPRALAPIRRLVLVLLAVSLSSLTVTGQQPHLHCVEAGGCPATTATALPTCYPSWQWERWSGPTETLAGSEAWAELPGWLRLTMLGLWRELRELEFSNEYYSNTASLHPAQLYYSNQHHYGHQHHHTLTYYLLSPPNQLLFYYSSSNIKWTTLYYQFPSDVLIADCNECNIFK